MKTAEQKESPCLSGKVIPAQFVQVVHAKKARSVSTQALSASLGESLEAHKEPKITLIREGEIVTTIEIRCACGAVIHLDCAY